MPRNNETGLGLAEVYNLCVRELFDIEVEGTQTAPKSMELFDSTILNVLCLAKARQHAHA